MGNEEFTEAATAVLQVVGTSAYLHGIGYSLEKFKQELDSAVRHIKGRMVKV